MRVDSTTRWLLGGAAALALAAGAAPAAAQEEAAQRGLALNRFLPAPAGDRMFGLPSPYAASPDEDGSPTLHLMLLADYAHNPLVLRKANSNDKVGSIVENQLFLHLNGSLSLWDRLHIHADLPVALVQTGDDPSAEGVAFSSPSSAQIGDLRLGLRLRLFGGYFDPVQIALGGYVWLPTGNGDGGSYVGEGSVRGMPQLIVGGRTDRLVWTSSFGVDLRPEHEFQGVQQGTMLHGGMGLALLFGEEQRIQVGPELTLSSVVNNPGVRSANLEMLLGGRYRFVAPFEAGIGLGPGLSTGIGTPDFRAVAMVSYTPEVRRRPEDRDGDGILDAQDACPDVAGVADDDPAKNGCPRLDRDKDGILDDVDACPDVPGVAAADPAKHGCPPPGDRDGDGITDDVDACPDVPGVASEDATLHGCPPPDRDGDGVPDAVDACPDIPGLKTQDPATNGCPGDRDGDTVRDDLDACPDEKGKPDPDPQKNGCPVAVRVTEGEIVILQQVQFDTGKATIKAASDSLLDEVAGALKDHPEIVKLEVQGHTDNRGGRALNQRLSQDRAAAVMSALVKRGIGEERLQAKGYGQDTPIADNAKDDGRQKNRRVQFKIVEKQPKLSPAGSPQPAPQPQPAQPKP